MLLLLTILAVGIFWLVGIGANVLAWYTGKARLDVLAFWYLPFYSIWFLLPFVAGLVIALFELQGHPTKKWIDTVGAKIAIGSILTFLAVWLGSAMSGVILRWFKGWKDGPTPTPLPANKDEPKP